MHKIKKLPHRFENSNDVEVVLSKSSAKMIFFEGQEMFEVSSQQLVITDFSVSGLSVFQQVWMLDQVGLPGIVF